MKFSLVNSKIALAGLTALSMLAFQGAAQAEDVVVDFSTLEVGQSIEGMGTVHELLDIQDMDGTGKAVFEGQGPGAYVTSQQTADGSTRLLNGGLADGGFASIVSGRKQNATNAFTFSFAEGTTVSEFSLEMFDYGDWNPFKATKHGVYLQAFDVFGDVVDEFSLEHQTGAGYNDVDNNIFKANMVGGRGDALRTTDDSPFGQTLMSVMGSGISQVKLSFDNNAEGRSGMSSDPNVAFRNLAFNVEDEPSVNSAKVPEPASVMGLLAVGAMGLGSLRKRQKQS